MKRVLIFALVLVLGTGLVGAFAEGQSENSDSQYGRGRGYDERPALEEVDLTGEVYFESLDFPVLKTGDGEFTLMVPRYYTYDFEIEDGQTISVEGFLGPEEATGGRFMRSADGEPHVMVTAATINGEEFDLDRGRSTMMRERPDPRSGGRRGSIGRSPKGGRW